MYKYIFFIGVIYLMACKQDTAYTSDQEGQPLPAFELRLKDSTLFNTANLGNAKGYILFYFSPTCPHCRKQTASMVKRMDKMKDLKICFFTVADFAAMRDYSLNYELQKYPNVLIGIDEQRFFSNHYETPGVPYTALFGADKKLKQVFLGETYASSLLLALDK